VKLHCSSKIVCVLGVLFTVLVATRLDAQDEIAKTTSEIVKAREYTASYVALAKQKLKDDDLVQAQKLYADAYADYSGWNSYVETALRNGKAKKLNLDDQYQKQAEDATKAATKFVGFVDTKTGQTKAVVAVLSSLADLGLKLWNGVKDRQTKDRNTAADSFAKATKWSSWSDIKAST
jgi:hypothetical protein